MPSLRPRLAAYLLLTSSLLLVPVDAAAQAWLPTRGHLDVNVAYTNILNQHHYLPSGEELAVGSTRNESLSLRLMYGLTDRLTVTGAIPFVKTSYTGQFPHPGEIDDGHAHTTFTDWRLGLHYQVTEGPVAFAPYVQYLAPITAYETMGHSAPGRGLEEFWVGFFAGRNLDLFLPRSYVQLRYNYSFVEKVAGVSHDRSNLDFEFGYRLAPRWTARAVVLYQDSYGGIDVPIPQSNPLYPYHDQLAAEDNTILGVGGSWDMTIATSIYFLYMESIRGTNGHKVDQSLTLGWSMNFAPRQ